MKQNQLGFSLVEIMITVMIIGILMAIAIPNYIKSVNIQKQLEARANLVSLVAAERSFKAQFNIVSSRLDMIGWHPTGQQTYGYGFTADYPPAANLPTPPFNPADTNCFDTVTSPNTCPAKFAAKWQNSPSAKNTFSAASFPANAPWHAYARANLGNASDDEWSIDSADNLLNTVPGM